MREHPGFESVDCFARAFAPSAALGRSVVPVEEKRDDKTVKRKKERTAAHQRGRGKRLAKARLAVGDEAEQAVKPQRSDERVRDFRRGLKPVVECGK